ncbi:MAG: hypothetical protein C3F07_05835 [Anaerolineales bacterium]|nr:DUF1697 domain-containing protein [Anaerolineae bacterium]PWB75250.1 MAG: hypothetical protein C3F07_05835 [Anaerolineales bacterium]
MNKYVAFLRAINVGGNTVIKMDELRKMFELLGLDNVRTYIQSGNVIFESDEDDASALEERIERQLEEGLGKRIQLFVRTMREIMSIAEATPFHPKENETMHIVFLKSKPERKAAGALMSFKSKADDFAIRGREVYNLRRDRDNSVFSNNLVEKTLGMSGTTRNLTTLRKIVEKYSRD